MDGMSLNNLIIEFNRLYNGADLKRLPIQYRDYTMWENNYNKSNEILEHERYWVNNLKIVIPPLNLPYDYKVSAIRSYEGNTITNVIDEKIFRKIEKYAKKIGMSSYMLFVSTFLILLHRYTGQDEIILGSPVANRNQKETKRMMGVLVNNIVIRSKLNEDETINEFFEKMKEQILSDISNQPYPFDMLIKKLNIKVDNSRNPMFDVMFTYQNKEENTVQLSGKSVNVLELDNNISKFNLSIEVKPKMHTINVEYCTKLFKKETIENLFEHYLYMLTDIIENVDAKIKEYRYK